MKIQKLVFVFPAGQNSGNSIYCDDSKGELKKCNKVKNTAVKGKN